MKKLACRKIYFYIALIDYTVENRDRQKVKCDKSDEHHVRGS